MSKQQPHQTQKQRSESPPFVTSEMHQDMETYQRNFWIRQMEKVEEQVSIPDDQAAAALAASRGSSGRMGKSRNGEGGEVDEEDRDEEDEEEPSNPLTFAQMSQSAKELMELFKPQAGQLPLARIKKVMKASDDEVKMISAEAPILFARACEIFIADLTCRSYMNAIQNRRRTVQRSDVVAAVAGSNLFDFLVDIIPREGGGQDSNATGSAGRTSSSKKDSDNKSEEEDNME